MASSPDLARAAHEALAASAPADTDLYTSRKGRCRGCGECCGRFLPLSLYDRLRLRAYARKHGVAPHAPRGEADLTCPYLTDELDCAVYPARPAVCRAYRCDKSAARDFAPIIEDPAFSMSVPYEPCEDMRRLAESIDLGEGGNVQQ